MSESTGDAAHLVKRIKHADAVMFVDILTKSDRLLEACAIFARMCVLDPDSISPDETMKLKQNLENLDKLFDTDNIATEIKPAVNATIAWLNSAKNVRMYPEVDLSNPHSLWLNGRVISAQLPHDERETI